jgi:[ribosomal protein S5]-alanine N-acetyltransferase
MILATGRLSLRPFEEPDWHAMHAIAADPEVARFMPSDPRTEHETRDLVQWMIQGPNDHPPHYDFAVLLQADGTLIGSCSLGRRYDEVDQAELSYMLNRAYWGHGYATEAAHAVLTYGFTELGLHRVFATCRPSNSASVRVLEKLGMQREGYLRQHRWMKGHWQDSLLFAVLDHEWRSQTP